MKQSIFDQCKWHNEPPYYIFDGAILAVTTGESTDFWRVTSYDFIHDNGHFFAKSVRGEFTSQLRVDAKFKELYDQAGLMVRIDEKHWIKIGAEFSDGQLMLSTVLTNEQSDWAVMPAPDLKGSFWIRITVSNSAIRAQYSMDGVIWPLLRLAPFPVNDTYHVGPMCCTPKRAGLEVTFSEFSIVPALDKDLHDLS